MRLGGSHWSHMTRAAQLGLSAADHLDRHDAYPFFDALGDLLKPDTQVQMSTTSCCCSAFDRIDFMTRIKHPIRDVLHLRP